MNNYLNSRFILSLIFSICIVFFLFQTFNLLGEEKEETTKKSTEYLRWKKITSAGSYNVQLREKKSKKEVLNEKTQKNQYEIDFDEGEYEFRIGVINKFGKLVKFSNWKDFNIIKSRVPNIEIKEVLLGGKDSQKQTVTLKGNNFTKKINVKIQSEKDKIPISNIKYKSKKEIDFDLDLNNASNGYYDLVLENPKGKSFTKKNFFVLGEDLNSAKKMAKKIKGKKNWKAFAMSTALPGLGQAYKGHIWKGFVYPFIYFGLLGASASTYSSIEKAKKDYEATNERSFLMLLLRDDRLRFIALYTYTQNNRTRSTINSKIAQLTQIEVTTVLFYLFNLTDVLLFKTKEKKEKFNVSYRKFYPRIEFTSLDLQTSLNFRQNQSDIKLGFYYLF